MIYIGLLTHLLLEELVEHRNLVLVEGACTCVAATHSRLVEIVYLLEGSGDERTAHAGRELGAAHVVAGIGYLVAAGGTTGVAEAVRVGCGLGHKLAECKLWVLLGKASATEG